MGDVIMAQQKKLFDTIPEPDEGLLTCVCGFVGHMDEYDCLGLCDGVVQCNKCFRHIDIATGLEHVCGDRCD